MSWGHPVVGINIWSSELRRDDKADPPGELLARISLIPCSRTQRSLDRSPCYLTSAISARVSVVHGRTRVACSKSSSVAVLARCLRSRELSISSDGTRRRSILLDPEGSRLAATSWNVSWRQEATSDNQTRSCTRPPRRVASSRFFFLFFFLPSFKCILHLCVHSLY